MKAALIVFFTVLAATFAACAPNPELLEYETVQSERLKRPMSFSVLRAPVQDATAAAALPVVVLLHGMGDDHRSLDRFGLSDDLREGMRVGRLPLAHFVMPNGERGFYFNWHDGTRPYEAYILEEVLPQAERQLGVSPTRQQRHLMGVSMGGTGAINIGLRHPDMFASITSFSGVVLDREQADEMRRKLLVRLFFDVDAVFGDGTDQAFSDSYNPYLLVEKRPPTLPQRMYLTYGTDERKRYDPTTGKFHQHLVARGIEHKFFVYEGGHGWSQWAPHFADALDYALR